MSLRKGSLFDKLSRGNYYLADADLATFITHIWTPTVMHIRGDGAYGEDDEGNDELKPDD
jgi:hypothetical protein